MEKSSFRWFYVTEFVIVVICCITLSIFPQLGWWPLVIAGLPWVARVYWKDIQFKSTRFDLLLLLFVVSALISFWAAYDQEQAQQKLLLILGAVFLFYALANQPFENLWMVVFIISLWGMLTNLIFFLITDWQIFAPDIDIIGQVGGWWMASRPVIGIIAHFNIHQFHPNFIGGVNAILLPLCLAFLTHYWKKKNPFLITFSGVSFGIFLLGLVLSSSRAAWMATSFGLGLFGVMKVQAIQSWFLSKKILLLLPIILIVIGILVPIVLGEFLVNSNPVFAEITSLNTRVSLARESLYLISDFPFTGGGLSSFSGLYSEYILAIPFFMFSYSHNMLLDIGIEQGITGLLLWISIILICTITLIGQIKFENGRNPNLTIAIYASLVTLLAHGILDNPLYSNLWGLSWLFFLPGLTSAIYTQEQALFSLNKLNQKIVAVSFFVTITIVIFFFKPLSGLWYSNIGSIQMAKQDLIDWPTGNWDPKSSENSYEKVNSLFTEATKLQPFNRTAHHRLGLIKMAQHEYKGALPYLENATAIAPGHRGIQKTLGYCYTWLGETEKALEVLMQIPEAKSEMVAYSTWWQAEGRDDLASKAQQMAELLDLNNE